MDEIGLILGQIWAFIQGFGDMSLLHKISGITLLLIAVWKSSIVKPLWDKLGAAKILVAPALGMIAAVVSVEPFSWAAIWQGLQGGVLAIALHELLDAVKLMPWVGDKYKTVIDFISGILFKPEVK